MDTKNTLPFISVAQAAEMLDASKRWVYLQIENQTFKAVHIGGRTYLMIEDIARAAKNGLARSPKSLKNY